MRTSPKLDTAGVRADFATMPGMNECQYSEQRVRIVCGSMASSQECQRPHSSLSNHTNLACTPNDACLHLPPTSTIRTVSKLASNITKASCGYELQRTGYQGNFECLVDMDPHLIVQTLPKSEATLSRRWLAPRTTCKGATNVCVRVANFYIRRLSKVNECASRGSAICMMETRLVEGWLYPISLAQNITV